VQSRTHGAGGEERQQGAGQAGHDGQLGGADRLFWSSGQLFLYSVHGWV
jgi:hypothetical protein